MIRSARSTYQISRPAYTVRHRRCHRVGRIPLPHMIADSDRHVVRGTLRRRPAALVTYLSGGDVAVAEKLPNFRAVDAGVEEQGRGGSSQ